MQNIDTKKFCGYEFLQKQLFLCLFFIGFWVILDFFHCAHMQVFLFPGSYGAQSCLFSEKSTERFEKAINRDCHRRFIIKIINIFKIYNKILPKSRQDARESHMNEKMVWSSQNDLDPSGGLLRTKSSKFAFFKATFVEFLLLKLPVNTVKRAV